jgi:CBS domain containing-hemolysin-like protein
MEEGQVSLDLFGIAWRLGATLFFVFLNGFFVAAEFALVKVRHSRIRKLVEEGSRRAKVADHLLSHLDRYLSACQLGITLASLALGALGEPAVARLLVAGAGVFGLVLDATDPVFRIVAFGLAFLLITILHMTVGEQAPKIWALQRAEKTALQTALPLRAFALFFRPLVTVVNSISNGILRSVGVSLEHGVESTHSAEEIRSILSVSARAGHISERQREIAENVFRLIDLEVRHILVPRVDVVFLSLQDPPEENLRRIRESGHSRFPLCEAGLDTLVGFVHSKDVLDRLLKGGEIDLRHMARRAVLVPDTQPLSELILDLQMKRSHCAAVVDEHGTVTGLAYLEDALEEIVGPMGDEFDLPAASVHKLGKGQFEVPGSMALPEASERFSLNLEDADEDTIGGHIVALLGRLPRRGDQLTLGSYLVTIQEVTRRRIGTIRFELQPSGPVQQEKRES